MNQTSGSMYPDETEIRLQGRELALRYLAPNGQRAYTLHAPKIPAAPGGKSAYPAHLWPEMLIQLSGATRFDCPGESFVLHPGEICIMPRGIPHRETVQPTTGEFRQWVLMPLAHGVYFHFGVAGADRTPEGKAGTFVVAEDLNSMAVFLDQAVSALRTRDSIGKIMAEAQITLFFGTFIRMLDAPCVLPVDEPPKIRECRYLVGAQLRNPQLSVASIARQMRCAADYLSHLFSQETGMTLSQYILSLRMRLACDLLRQTTFSIKEIAFACGFADASYFGRQFKAFMHQTPSAYRASPADAG